MRPYRFIIHSLKYTCASCLFLAGPVNSLHADNSISFDAEKPKKIQISQVESRAQFNWEDGSNQFRWENVYAPAVTKSFVAEQKSLKPMLGSETIAGLENAIAYYQIVNNRGGWEPIPNGHRLSRGIHSKRVKFLRQRLLLTGDLTEDENKGETKKAFSKNVATAVRRFQTRHGLPTHGIVNKQTLQVLNIPIEDKIEILKLNLERAKKFYASLKTNPLRRYIIVNIPAAQIETVEEGYVYSRHNAVVGQIDRQTPELTSKIHELNFNPYWHVPVSIIRRDILPELIKNPAYLKNNKIRVFRESYEGEEVDVKNIDWKTVKEDDYLFRQDPGANNAMSSVKINFHNKHAVYLHDTPSKKLFSEDERFYSSGCVRVDKVQVLVDWVLKGQQGWDRKRIDSLAVSGERVDVNVEQAPQLKMIYLTAWSNKDESIHFRSDIYNIDAEKIAAKRGIPPSITQVTPPAN